MARKPITTTATFGFKFGLVFPLKTAQRAGANTRPKGKLQVVSEAKDNFRKHYDVRWQFGVPPNGNASFIWVQHFIHQRNNRDNQYVV